MSDALLKNTFQKISPAYELVADVTVATATTQVDFSGLNFGKDDDLLLVSSFAYNSGGGSEFYLFFNDNITQTNYYTQFLRANSTTVSGSRVNQSFLEYVSGSPYNNSFTNTKIKLTNNGYGVFQTSGTQAFSGSSVSNEDSFVTTTFTMSSITKMSIKAQQPNGIGIGSRFQLYRLKAKKVADIIVSSATTQVDITGLNIDKDSEYMLVSDISNPTAFSPTYSLFANGNNAQTQYYRQYLYASNTTVSGGRANSNELSMSGGNNKSFAVTYIKLTNNGYLAIQTSESRDYSTLLNLMKQYMASTFTISSITYLKIESNVTNAIGIGSRFTLYRLDDGVATPDSSIRKVGNLVYMTSNSAPSPYVATVSPTPTSNSAYMAFDATNSTGPTWNYITTVAWAKMIWTAPIRIKEMVVRANRSGQANTAIRVYGIKADASEISLYNASPSSNTDITITPSDTTTPFVGVRMEIDGRSDLIVSILNCRITQWYTT